MPSTLTPDNFMAQQNLDPDSFMALFGTNPADAILAKQGISAKPAGKSPGLLNGMPSSPEIQQALKSPAKQPKAESGFTEGLVNTLKAPIAAAAQIPNTVSAAFSGRRPEYSYTPDGTQTIGNYVSGPNEKKQWAARPVTAAEKTEKEATALPEGMQESPGLSEAYRAGIGEYGNLAGEAAGIGLTAGASRVLPKVLPAVTGAAKGVAAQAPTIADIPFVGKTVKGLAAITKGAIGGARQGMRDARTAGSVAANRAANPPVNVGEVGPAGSPAPVPEFIPEAPTQTPSGRVPGNSPAPIEPQALPSGRRVGPAPQRPQATAAPAPPASTDPLPPRPLEVPRAPNSVTSPTPGGIVDRSAMNNMIHAVGARLGMDHEMLSDAARRTYRVKSMTQMSEDQMLDMYANLLKKSPVGSPLPLKTTGKPSELTLEDQLRQSIAATLKRRAATAGPVEPLPPGALE